MVRRNVKNKIIAAASAATIFIGSAFAASYLTINKRVEDQKPYQYVLRDIENFGVDTGVVDSFGHGDYDKYVRLKFDEDRPVIVDCDDEMPEKEMMIIKKVVDYYNIIFSTINENYKFVIRDEDTDVKLTDTIITMDNGDINKIGQNETKVKLPDFGNGNFITKSNVLINWDKIKDLDELYIYSVILHEMGHSLGFGDVYYTNEYRKLNSVDMTTMMQIDNYVTSALYPNDYAVLQALYSKEYEKHGNYEDAVKIVREKINRYTRGFYKYYAGVMIESEYGATNNLTREELGSKITWKGVYDHNNDYVYTLHLNDDDTCELIIQDRNGRVLQKGSGETVFVDGMLFAKRIVFDNAYDYSQLYPDDIGAKIMLCIYKESGCSVVRVEDGTHKLAGFVNLNRQQENMR